MREIKFRGKSKNVNEWCYGTYIFTDDNTNDPFRTRPFRESHRIVSWYSGDWNMGGWDYEEVIPETIGQYTGLKDKNGKEIYEGDIVKRSGLDRLGKVYFHQGAYRVDFGHFTGLLNIVLDEFDTSVIGNIYDTLELIKEEEK